MSSAGTIFDLVDLTEDTPNTSPENRQRGRGSEAVRQVGLGVAQGVGDLAQLEGMLEAGIQYPLNKALGASEEPSPVVSPGQKARYEASYQEDLPFWQQAQLLNEDDDLMPMLRLPGGRQALDQTLSEIPEEGLLQEGIRRVTRSLPGLAAGPAVAGEMAGREFLGLAGKEAVKSLGGGEGLQAGADLLASLAPLPKKAILAGDKVIKAAETGTVTTQKEMVDFARKAGMTDQEIAPLVRDGWFSNLLAKVSSRSGASERALDQTKSAVGKNFQYLRESPAAQQEITGAARSNVLKQLQGKLYDDLPAGARNAISEDLQQLMDGPMNGDRLMKFWGDINSYFKEHPKLGALKGPIKDALSYASPELAKDFNLTNTLSQRSRDISSKLKPSVATNMFSGGEALSAVGALITGNMPILTGVAGVAGGRKVAEMMLTNPRFHNLTKKMVTTMNAGQAKATSKILDQLTGLVQKESPELASEMQKLSMDELEQMLNQNEM